MMITSTANPQIKQIRKLRERKERQQSGLFYIEGLRIVGQAVQQGAELEALIICPELLDSTFGSKLVEDQFQRGAKILQVSAKVFESFALKEGPQGIAALVHQRWQPLTGISVTAGSLWVGLDSPQDPGNLGTIMRTLDSVGGQGIILLDSATDPYDPTAVRASMGSVFNLKLVKTGVEDFSSWKHKTGIPWVGTSGAASQDYHHCVYPDPMILLMGSERQGLQERLLALCDLVVRIPMVGSSDSLNLAVSTAVLLYEIFNRRRDAG